MWQNISCAKNLPSKIVKKRIAVRAPEKMTDYDKKIFDFAGARV